MPYLVMPQQTYGSQIVGGPGSGSMSVNSPSTWMYPSAYNNYGQWGNAPAGNPTAQSAGYTQAFGARPTGAAARYTPGSTATQTGGGVTGTSSSTYMGGRWVGNPNETAMQYLNSVIRGEELPFGQAQRSAQMSEAASMTAAAERAQNGMIDNSIASGGASASDPSVQNARRAAMASRQSNNVQAVRALNSEADKTNFNARLQAAGMAAEMQRNAALDALRAMQGYNNTRGGSDGQQAYNPYSTGSGRVMGYNGLDMY